MKRGGQAVLGALLLSGFLVVLLALFAPVYAIIPSAILVAWIWVSGRADRHALRKAWPCSICGKRFAGANMVEHHVSDHRECDS